ncbi:MAG: DNA polymerase IV [Candidatus Thorarchaeota archaeon]
MSSELFIQKLQQPEKKWIVLADLDSFYASVEERLHPEYKDKPIIVGPNPKKSKRGVVLTANYIARNYGVKSALPLSKAYELCPNGIYLFSGFKYYSEASKEVMNILRTWSKAFMQVSIDEAYLDITDLVGQNDPKSTAKEIQTSIISETGLPVSLGISVTKALAKIASGMEKPKGITIFYPEQLPHSIEHLLLKEIPGIGKKTFPRLKKRGLEKICDITKYPRIHWKNSDLLQYVWDLAHGLTSNNLSTEGYKSQSMSTERTFGEDVTDFTQVINILTSLTDKLLENLKPFQTISIKVRLANFKTYTRSKSFVRYLTKEDINLIKETVLILIEEFRQYSSLGFRLLGVRFSNLQPKKISKHSLDEFLNV